MVVHALGLVAGAACVGLSLLRLRRMVLRSEAVSAGPVYENFVELCRKIGLRRRVLLRFSPEPIMPMALGILRPAVMLPVSMVEKLNAAEINTLLAHELAHHRRLDLWVNWAQLIIGVLWWFNPIVWLLNRAIRRSREDCCDDLLLHRNLASSATYCDTLIRAARQLSRRTVLVSSLGFAQRLHPLATRMRRIMDPRIPRATRLSMSGLTMTLALTALLLPGVRGQLEGQPALTIDAGSAEGGTQKDRVKKGKLGRSTEESALSGSVVDADDQPIQSAHVTLYFVDSTWGLGNEVVETVTTDADGKFSLQSDLTYENANGTTYTDHYVLLATHPGFALAWKVIVSGSERELYHLTLTEPTTQKVLVTDSDDEPLSGSLVYLRGAGRKDDSNALFRTPFRVTEELGLLAATTDSDGIATVTNLPKTWCSLGASIPGYTNESWHGKDLPQEGAHIRLTPAATVSGRVLTPEGTPVPNAEVWFQAAWNLHWYVGVTTEEDGRYEVDDLVGRGASWCCDGGTGQYKVTIRHKGYATSEQTVQVDPGEEVTEFDINAVQGTLVRVSVLEPESNRPLGQARP